ncbi:MAG: hypothetical protein JWL90_1396 [Chthoniobacteraceae bacterium]|nr:hypothetical protein [Chthoniobacteraceae bacterium]
MILASIEGNLLFLVVVAVGGLINWLTKKDDKPVEKPKIESPRAQPMRSAPGADSEAERMRRFMEALGIPNHEAPPPPVKRREPPQMPAPMPRIEPRGTVVSPWPVPVKRQRTPVPPAPKKSQAPAYVPPPVPVEKIAIPELKTPALPAWDTVSSHVSAIPFEASHADMRDAYKGESAVDQPIERLRDLIKSPADLRAAILLREIIGPPRGLQTEERFPTFR